MNNIHLKAFTLIELVVAMLISATVIALASGVFLSFSNMYKKAHFEESKELTFCFFENNLRREIDKAYSLTYLDDILTLTFLHNPPLTYAFEDSLMIKTTFNSIDTFRLNYQEFQLGTLKTNRGDWITDIYFMLIINKLEYPIHIRKVYDNETLFNNNDHAHQN